MYPKPLLCLTQFIILSHLNSFLQVQALRGQHVQTIPTNERTAIVCLARYNANGGFMENMICTGTLVSFSYVLTAEHCLDYLNNHRLEVKITYITNANVHYFPVWWISYDQWARVSNVQITTANNDIAFIHLFGLIPDVIPHIITPVSFEEFYGYDVEAYGCTHAANGQELVITKATVKLYDSQTCENDVFKIAQKRTYLPRNFLCTKAVPYSQLDITDSGGPLSFYGLVIGINAGLSPPMDGQFHADKVNIHMNLESYRNFITHIMSIV